MKPKIIAALLCSLPPLITAPLLAQPAGQDLAAKIEALEAGQQEIRKELAEIKKLLQARPAAAQPRRQGTNVKGVVFDLADNPVRGASTAKLTLVEFSDYQ